MAITYLKRSVLHVLQRFGASSNEYARELHKYVQLLALPNVSNGTGEEQDRKDLIDDANRLLEAYSPSTEPLKERPNPQ